MTTLLTKTLATVIIIFLINIQKFIIINLLRDTFMKNINDTDLHRIFFSTY